MTFPQIPSELVEALKLDLVGPENDHAFAHELPPDVPSRWYLSGSLVTAEAPPPTRRPTKSPRPSGRRPRSSTNPSTVSSSKACKHQRFHTLGQVPPDGGGECVWVEGGLGAVQRS